MDARHWRAVNTTSYNPGSNVFHDGEHKKRSLVECFFLGPHESAAHPSPCGQKIRWFHSISEVSSCSCCMNSSSFSRSADMN